MMTAQRGWIRLGLGVMLLGSFAACMAAVGSDLEGWSKGQWGLATPNVEELWILSADEVAAARASLAPITFQAESREGRNELTWESFAVEADVLGRVAHVTLRQQLKNPTASPMEVWCTLPLPRHAALADFVLQLGERRIRAVVHARDEAERMYLVARQTGRLATLIAADRPDDLRQRLSLPAGALLALEASYVHALPSVDGGVELAFPRTDASAEGEARYSVTLDAGRPLASVEWLGATGESLSSALEAEHWKGAATARDSSLDVRLRYRVVAGEWSAAFWRCTDAAGEPWFLLATFPPSAPTGARIAWSGLGAGTQPPLTSATDPNLPWILVGRISDGFAPTAVLEEGGTRRELPLAERSSTSRAARAVPVLWCQSRICELARELERGADARAVFQEARALALDHGIVSFLTSLVLVDARR
jgi:hypothetical protein